MGDVGANVNCVDTVIWSISLVRLCRNPASTLVNNKSFREGGNWGGLDTAPPRGLQAKISYNPLGLNGFWVNLPLPGLV